MLLLSHSFHHKGHCRGVSVLSVRKWRNITGLHCWVSCLLASHWTSIMYNKRPRCVPRRSWQFPPCFPHYRYWRLKTSHHSGLLVKSEFCFIFKNRQKLPILVTYRGRPVLPFPCDRLHLLPLLPDICFLCHFKWFLTLSFNLIHKAHYRIVKRK